MNPQGKMPALRLPSGEAFGESDTIARYLLDRFADRGPSLLGAGVEERSATQPRDPATRLQPDGRRAYASRSKTTYETLSGIQAVSGTPFSSRLQRSRRVAGPGTEARSVPTGTVETGWMWCGSMEESGSGREVSITPVTAEGAEGLDLGAPRGCEDLTFGSGWVEVGTARLEVPAPHQPNRAALKFADSGVAGMP